MSYENDPDQVDPIPPHPEQEYGFMEREVAFKLLASHAMVDAEFFEQLKANPEEAAGQLHIRLDARDLNYLEHIVEWDEIGKYARDIRERLHLESVTNSW
jgi:hypothetical protein